MSALSLPSSLRASTSDFDTSDDDSDNDNDNDGQGSMSSSRLLQTYPLDDELSAGLANDGMVSVTVEKKSTTQKAGIGLVERKDRVYISSIAENGLFDHSECQVGDVIVAINGKRLKRGQGAGEVMQVITQATAAVTLLLKKTHKDVKSLAEAAQRRKRTLHKTKRQELTVKQRGNTQPSESDSPPQSKQAQGPKRRLLGDADPPSKGALMDLSHDATNTSNKTANISESSSEHVHSVMEQMAPSSPVLAEAMPKKSKAAKTRVAKSDREILKSPALKPKKHEKRSTSVRETAISPSEDVTRSRSYQRPSSERLPSPEKLLSPSPSSKLSLGGKSATSVGFDFNRLEGDFIKITIKKESEDRPGILLDKVDGKLILVGLPYYEERQHVLGMQILAINGRSTCHTIAKAIYVISRTEKDVQLVLDFSPPLDTAPVGKKTLADSQSDVHDVTDTLEGAASTSAEFPPPPGSTDSPTTGTVALNVSSRKIAYRKIAADSGEGGSAAEESMSLAQSERTFKANNRAPPGTRRAPRAKRPPKYHVDEFASDSDG